MFLMNSSKHIHYRWFTRCLLVIFLSLTGSANTTYSATNLMDLSGTWRVRLDPADVGIAESWQSQSFSNKINLPGSLAENGYGEDPRFDSPWISDGRKIIQLKDSKFAPYLADDDLHMPCWLQPVKFFVGAAWYQKEVDIPREWEGKRIMLFLERPHWETRVWVDDAFVSKGNSLGTAHEHDLSAFLTPGRHRIVIRVDNRMIINVGPNSHSVSDHTQSSWNGIVGRLELTATDSVWIEDLQVIPVAAKGTATVRIKVGRMAITGKAQQVDWHLSYRGSELSSGLASAVWKKTDGSATFELDASDDVKLWDEFHPNLYTLSVSIGSNGDQKSVKFGFRDLQVDGTRFTINGRALFLRGTLECAIFPLTGYPPTDVDSWKRIIRICKEHGLNHIRFHSWCPPEAAFIAADELGFYYQVECSSWANQGATIGDGKPLDKWLYEEAHRMVRAYGNHPSFAFMAYGNEPAGKNRVRFLEQWCAYWKKENPRCLYTGGAGWPEIHNSDYHNIPSPRIQQWGAGLKSRINASAPETLFDYSEIIQSAGKPIVSHEIGQWCVYPNFTEMDKYTGVLKPRNFEIFQDLLEKNHMADQAEAFLMASGKLQVLCYKEEIEAALRTPGFAGFQLLDLHDFPGQGTALVGILDPFWDAKPYVTADEFSQFCGPTVPLARMEKRVWTRGETFHAGIGISHFGPAELMQAKPEWRILDASGMAVATGVLQKRDIPISNGFSLGSIDIDCSKLSAPAKYKLVVEMEGAGAINDWDFWVYPRQVNNSGNEVLITNNLDAQAEQVLKSGGKVLLLPDPDSIQSEVAIGFSSVFWNTLWTNNQPPHTLGILCDPEHPVFAGFPTEYHSNWQWWELIHGSSAMILDGLPPACRPLVQPIDNWFDARRLGLLLETNVLGGKLMICSMDIRNDLDQRPAARQLRKSILDYMQSARFQPENTLSGDQVLSLLRPDAI